MSKMPVLFVGHGSPMNAIEDNNYSRNWRNLAERIPKPGTILSVSAHWYTHGTRVMNEENPKTIYDMYGFPEELYEVLYDPAGSPGIAKAAKELISRETKYDNSWGIDHGTWSVLVHMYPDRDIPVFQISIDASAPPEEHYKIGKELGALREQGVLIFGSGNVVHNLRLVDWHKANKGFDWAYEFDEYIYENIMDYNHDNILKYNELGDIARLAVPIPDHFYPLLYTLGASDEDDKVSVHNKSCELGSLTMTAYLWE
ncbi:MAG TPA: 4,5-DOPA dioxygenase extradiol [Bacillota bacterium]|nr:4,5-DOPA dioxygenase extradiol [Bacillota bacterium]HPD01488.1 4,5-DOPA dioxygenase extradiol [Acetivibrio sp.]HRS20454.1 4,5-DOPA dioxygenase extradiol [Clostridia bacterium]HQE65203.1 4,5-DOPA dioxygenase extradiol [Bacillota bacterium]HQI15401.1 4,5-DOPA dioxygenase extradiol [Bacillota bacterium]